MTNSMKKAWAEIVRPFFARPKRLQVAALCYTQDGPKKQVLLITSRDTGRWILPKGWPIDGMNAPQAAMQEAWEEAGIKDGEINETPVGSFEYTKQMDAGGEAAVETHVYAVKVNEIVDTFPESEERTRKWVTADEAAKMVSEPGLQEILQNL